MNQDILLSKIVPNSTDTTWSQAYTTLNVYIALSIESSESKSPVTTLGKELLEKLQREFFALDEKNLENIKKAVGNVSKSIADEHVYSMLVGTIVNDVLYIVVASEGQVIMKREGKIGVIAKGVARELHGFSGKLKHDDIVILQTGDFSKKIPLNEISEYLSAQDVSEIAENITPLIHEGSKGTESAIILQYKDPLHTKSSTVENSQITDEKTDETEEKDLDPETIWTKQPHENRNIEELIDDKEEDSKQEFSTPQRRGFRFPNFPTINFKDKRIFALAAVVILGAILIGGVFMQNSRQNEIKSKEEFDKIYQPAKNKFDEGMSLASLNSSLALEDLNNALQLVEKALSQYKEGGTEHQQLLDLKSQIDEKILSLGGGGRAENAKEFLKPQGTLKSITAISARAGELVVVDKEGQQVVVIDSDGEIEKSYDIESDATFIASDDSFIYAMGSSVTKIDKGNGNVEVVLEEAKGISFDIFGSNFYILEGDDILKYRAPSENSSSYFTKDPGFSSTPTNISISGSIWVIEENGTLSRFTKGKKDDFEVVGLKAPFGSGSLVYADPDISNVYIMDVKNQRVVVINDEGEFVTQYEGSFIKGAVSFAIDEENNTGYVVSNGIITSFDL